MDDRQRRVWAETLRQIDDWEQGRIGLPRLVENLYGLLEASEMMGTEPADEFYFRWAELDAEMELRTEPWAPAGYPASDERLNAAIASIREHVHRVLNESPPSN
jgi:hypothetical protein